MTCSAQSRTLLSLSILVAHTQLACGGSAPPASAAAPAPSASGPTRHASWSYSGDNGPQRWGDLDPTYALCKTGQEQSPIDLPASPPRHEPAPVRPKWDPVPLRVTNNGHAIQVDDSAQSSLVVDGTPYHLAQFHFHSPAEHTVGGRAYDVEMHLVHKSDAGKLLVVAILFGSGSENTILAPVWDAMPSREGPSGVVAGTTIDVSSLLPSSPRYMRYAGSLTAPPCKEGVTWLVVEPDASAQMSPQQIKKLRDSTQPTTNRPLQAKGSREVVELVP
jgi:carbonic anhydrase